MFEVRLTVQGIVDILLARGNTDLLAVLLRDEKTKWYRLVRRSAIHGYS